MTLNNGFLKNILDLEENPNKPDAFNLQEQYSYFEKKINQISNKSIMAIVWDYWSGKSTMLYHIQNTYWGSVKWITFDAWSYPERKWLWDWLILRIVQEILWENYTNKTKNIIDGHSNNSTMATWISAIWTATSLMATSMDFSSIIPEVLSKIGISLKDFQELSNHWPIIRIEWFKELFRRILKEIWDTELIIVLEDIDRAWVEWIFFLETLFQFLKFESSWEFKIKFILPIARSSYVENIESYMKCVDNFEFFNVKPSGVDAYVQFTGRYFNKDLFLEYRRINPLYLLSEFFFLLSRNYEISFRKLGLMIRSANARYIYLKDMFPEELINPYTVIVLECMSYVEKIVWDKKSDYLSEFVKNRTCWAWDLFGAMLYMTQFKDDNTSLIRDNWVNEVFSNDEIKIADRGWMIFEYYLKYLRDLPPLSILNRPNRLTHVRTFDI